MLLIALAPACGGAKRGAHHHPCVLYSDRANQYREDQERRIGGSGIHESNPDRPAHVPRQNCVVPS